MCYSIIVKMYDTGVISFSMDEGSCILSVIGIFILIVLSSFFSACEMAYSTLNRIRLKAKADTGDVKAKQMLVLMEQFDELLSTILIGNNIVNIMMSSVGTVLCTYLIGQTYGATVSTIAITIIVLIFGEVTPKSLAKEMPEKFAAFSAPILRVLLTVFKPLNYSFSTWKRFLKKRVHVAEDDNITDDELVAMVNEAENDGELTAREGELIRSAIEFDDVEVAEILTPRVDVIAASDEVSFEELADLFKEHGYSRLPIYHGTIDNIIGVIHEKDYFAAVIKNQPTATEDLIEPTLYTTESMKISALLRTLREKRVHLAVVVDEYGGTSGIVTLEDVLEELVGEIWDEHDEVSLDFKPQANGDILVAGATALNDFLEELSIPEEEAKEIDSNTVSGLVQELLDTLPKVGDRFNFGGYSGVVTRTSKRRVQEVRIKKNEA